MTFPTIQLPSRPLMVQQGTIVTQRAVYFSAPVILILIAFMLIWETPGIVRDWTISQNPLTLDSGDIRDGKCTTRKGFFTTCSAHMNYSYNGQDYSKDAEVMFVDIHAGDYETNLVISRDHPDLATLSLGLDMLWNRIITLAVFVAILGWACLAMMYQVLRVWRVRGQLSQPDQLVPVPVEITAFDGRGKRLSVTYTDKISGRKTGRAAYTHFEPGQQPLLVGEKGNKAIGLAVWHGNSALPILLDNHLDRIDLSPQERSTILASLAADLAYAGSRPTLVPQRKRGLNLKRGLATFFLPLVLIIVAVFGYWLWYVTSADSQFNSPGMDINNMMPASLNRWGCDQLKSRFGDQRAPFGCTASDYTSWK